MTDSDGNKITKPGTVGVLTRAVVQLAVVHGERRRQHVEVIGGLRLVGYDGLLGAQSAVEWNGKRYAIDGEPRIYNGSRRTAHVDYVMIRR